MPTAPSFRECKKCCRIDRLQNFNNDNSCLYKKAFTCKKCYNQQVWEYRQKNPEKQRNWMLAKYGMTSEDYNRMFVSQNGVCAICRNPETRTVKKTGNIKKLAVDHCHTTGKVRGLLCDVCNTTLGKMNDSPALLRAAADYLEKAN